MVQLGNMCSSIASDLDKAVLSVSRETSENNRVLGSKEPSLQVSMTVHSML